MDRNENRKVVLTGGGTAGHVIPNLAFADLLITNGFCIEYIGSQGIEKDLVKEKGLAFHSIVTGKLRRELTLRNLLTPFQVFWGFAQSFRLLWSLQPKFVFSKGGYVSVPVCLAAWFLGIPCYSHESDLSPGLANRILKMFTKRFFYSFTHSKKHMPPSAICVGSPLRAEIFDSSPDRGLAFLGWTKTEKPILFVVGGSLGSVKLNNAIRGCFTDLVDRFRVVHVTGEGKKTDLMHPDYRSFTYIRQEYADVLAASDFVLARAGANSIFEFLAMQKPMLLMPLVAGSRGDQVENAASFVESGWAHVVDESAVDAETLLSALDALLADEKKMKTKQAEAPKNAALDTIWQHISMDIGT